MSNDNDAARPIATPWSAVERYRKAARQRLLGPPLTLDPAPPLAADTMWRGLVRDGEVRFLVVRCTKTVRENAGRLGAGAAVARLVAEITAASLLLRSTLNPGEQLQLIARHDGAVGRIIGDVWAEGGVRVTVEHPTTSATQAVLVGSGTLEISRTRGGQAVYRSSVPLQRGVADSVMNFLLASEQIVSLLRLDVMMTGARVEFVGGYLVQLMPEGKHDDLKRLVGNLDGIAPLHHGMTSDDPDGREWTSTLVDGFRWDQVARESVLFSCRCSEERVMTMLSTLAAADLRSLMSESNGIETTCEYCRTTFRVSPPQIRALLSEPS